MVQVSWRDLGSSRYEDMVAVLLSNLHPDSQRIDGAGGDDGRDVRWPNADGREHMFELKSFADRLGAPQKRQIKRSLARAGLLDPASWTLVVPIDPSPAEDRWFQHLQEGVSFPLTWRGRTWLDAQCAERPYIARYFIESSSGEVLRVLLQLNQEQAALAGGITDAISRMEALATLANELDPYYRVTLASDGITTRISWAPRYAGAEADSPWSLSITLAFADTPEGRARLTEVTDALDWGGPLSISPSEMRGLEAHLPAGLERLVEGEATLIAMPATIVDGPGEAFLLVVRREMRTVASTLVHVKTTRAGQRGVVEEGSDRSGLIKVRIKRDLTTNVGHITIGVGDVDAPVMAEEVGPALSVLSELGNGAEFGLRGVSGTPATDFQAVTNQPLLDPRFAALVRDIATIQEFAGERLPIRLDFDAADVAAIPMAAHLARGGTTTASTDGANISVSMTVVLTITQDQRAALAREPSKQWAWQFGQPYVVDIQGHSYHIGKGSEVFLDAGELTPESRKRLLREDEGPIAIDIVPVSGATLRVRLWGLEPGDASLKSGPPVA